MELVATPAHDPLVAEMSPGAAQDRGECELVIHRERLHRCLSDRRYVPRSRTASPPASARLPPSGPSGASGGSHWRAPPSLRPAARLAFGLRSPLRGCAASLGPSLGFRSALLAALGLWLYAFRKLRAAGVTVPLLEGLRRDLALDQELRKFPALCFALERHCALPLRGIAPGVAPDAWRDAASRPAIRRPGCCTSPCRGRSRPAGPGDAG